MTLRGGNWRKDLKVDPTNADVLQTVELPADVGGSLDVEAPGKGQVVLQTVRRFNVPAADEARRSVFDLKVDYGTTERRGRRPDHDLDDRSSTRRPSRSRPGWS